MKEEDYQVVQRELARRLGKKAIPEKAWQALRTHYDELLMDARLRGDWDEEPWEDLMRYAEPICDATGGGGGSQETTAERIPAQLRVSEIERSRVFSEYVAQVAAGASVVGRFRSRILSNGLLTPEQARALLRSPVAAHWPPDLFAEFQVPFVGHNHRVKSCGRDETGPYSLIEVTSTHSGLTRRLKDRRPLEPGAWEVTDFPEDARSHVRVAQKVKGYKVLSFPGEDDQTHRVLVKASSVLGYLHKQVGLLLKDYPWFESDAVWFMLTGEVPWVVPVTWRARARGTRTISSDSFSHGFITLTVEPWISADTVRRTYQDIQKGLLGGDNQPTRPKGRTLFSFVTEKIGPAPLSPKEKRHVAPELVAEWDKRHPQWAYGEDTRTFWRDYNLARRQITSPAYEWSA
jgi:hypothetical protein